MCSLCKLFYYINYLEILIYNTDFINCCVHNVTYILALRYIYRKAGKRSIRHGFNYIKSAIILNFFKSEL